MMRRDSRKGKRAGGFSIVEMMIGVSCFTIAMGAVYTASSSLMGTMNAAENYSVGQLQVVDYLSLDLRRAHRFDFSGDKLPLDISLPQFYAADGRTPNAPRRTLVTSTTEEDKKKHKVFSARYYYHYGTLGGTVNVRYYLSDNTLYRKEDGLPARVIGTGIDSIKFSPNEGDLEENPYVTTTVKFLPSKRAKRAPAPLTATTFLRQYYYSDY